MALGGFGWLLQSRPAKRADASYQFIDQLQLTLVKCKANTPTPREVALGYDTKVVITLGLRGNSQIAPKPLSKDSLTTITQAELVSQTGRKWRIKRYDQRPYLPSAETIPFQYSYLSLDSSNQVGSPNQASFAFLLNLASIPPREGKLTLHYTLASVRRYFVSREAYSHLPPNINSRLVSTHFAEIQVASKPIDQVLIVRESSKPVTRPKISHDCPLSLAESYLEGHIDDPDVVITVKDKAHNTRSGKLTWNVSDLHVEDSLGKRHMQEVFFTAERSTGLGEDFHHFKFPTQIDSIPPSVGVLTLKGKISVNEMWPLDFAIVVRQKWKSTVLTRELRLHKTKVIPTEEDRKYQIEVQFLYSEDKPLDTEIDIEREQESEPEPQPDLYPSLLPSRSAALPLALPRFNPILLRLNLYNRIEDENGRVYQALDDSTECVRAHKIQQIGNTIHWIATYSVDATQLPPNRKYTVKMHIGLEGVGILPVEIPLPRQNTKS